MPLAGLALMTAGLSAVSAKTVPTVSVANYAFGPAKLTINAGDTVTFVNRDDETHTATALDGTFDSGRLERKAAFSHTFAKPGTYDYHCRIHTSMKGVIVVKPAESPQ